MVLWHVTSYHDGLALEYQRLLAISRLQEAYGRQLWRWKAPLRELLALRTAPAATALGTGAPIAVAEITEPAPPAAEPAAEPSSAPSPSAPAAVPPSVFPLLALLKFLPKQHDIDIELPAPLPVRLSAQDRKLVSAASALLRDATGRGKPLRQSELARELRAQGFSIANERLRWLTEAAGGWPSTRQPPSSQGES